MLLPILRAPHKQKKSKKRKKRKYKKNKKCQKKKKIYIYIYIYQLRRTYWNSREITKNWLRRVTTYKIGKFDPVDKDNSIFEEENSKLHV
jgi:hypothetical protein